VREHGLLIGAIICSTEINLCPCFSLMFTNNAKIILNQNIFNIIYINKIMILIKTEEKVL
jgi:hypothetical protein